jgi:hypothetical protein
MPGLTWWDWLFAVLPRKGAENSAESPGRIYGFSIEFGNGYLPNTREKQ